MMHVPDEMLMAYADNELSPREREQLEAWLDADESLKARLEPFVATGPSLAAFFDAPLNEPVPPRLLEAVSAPLSGAHSGQRPRATPGRSTGWLETIGSFLFPESPRLAAAFGLAALLIAGGSAGWVIGRDTSGSLSSNALVALSHGELVASGPLLAALETEPSKVLTGDVPASGIVPLQSFRNHDGVYCREYRAGGPNGHVVSGVACRQSGGAWGIAAHVETRGASGGSGASEYQTASGSGAETLNAVIDSLIAGDVLGAEDEAATIARRWAPIAR